MSALTTARATELAAAYARTEPFAGVESTAFETVPAAVRAGDLRWRDAEWMVRWYYRRHLSSRYNRRRGRVESAFRENDWPAVRAAIESTVTIDEPAERVAALLPLAGVDVGVATGMLYFVDPARDIVMGEPEWLGLGAVEGGEFAPPETLSPATYVDYRARCTSLAGELDVDLITLQRALWRLGVDR